MDEDEVKCQECGKAVYWEDAEEIRRDVIEEIESEGWVCRECLFSKQYQ